MGNWGWAYSGRMQKETETESGTRFAFIDLFTSLHGTQHVTHIPKAFFLLKYFAREASIGRLLIRLRRRGASIRRVREGIFAGSVFFWREG